MVGLSNLFQSHPMVATYYTTVTRFVFVLLALFIVFRSIKSLLRAKSPPEIWGYLSLPDSSIKPILHWENVIGRDKSTDIQIDFMTVSRNHGTLVRDDKGNWRYNDLGSKGGSFVNGKKVIGPTNLEMGDTITVGGVDCVLLPPSLEEKQHNLEIRQEHTAKFSPWPSLIALTIFQFLTCIQFIAARGENLSFTVLLSFFLFTVVMWVYCIVMTRLKQNAFEVETIAFFLCLLNLSVVASSNQDSIMKQLFAIFLGMALFLVLCWYLRNLKRAKNIRRLLVIISVILLIINLVFGSSSNGAVNWVNFGGYNLQPSELVKIAFIFIGAGTLDELYEKKNLTMFMVFSVFCLGSLALMNDFGTAAIFFVTFLIISFLRSGEFSKLILVVGVCGLGILLAIRFIPHITSRFATWTHAWDYPDAGGFQQVRAMSAGASGGCFGLGSGNGWFHSVFAGDTDLVFSLICEEWGLIIALLATLSLIALCLFAVRAASFARSTFYTIAACAATSLIIFQTILNVLGSLDILPFTGVTLPFISNGGTSMLASWGLLAFLKAADTRQNASFAVSSAKIDAEEAFMDKDDKGDEEDEDKGDIVDSILDKFGRKSTSKHDHGSAKAKEGKAKGKRSSKSKKKSSKKSSSKKATPTSQDGFYEQDNFYDDEINAATGNYYLDEIESKHSFNNEVYDSKDSFYKDSSYTADPELDLSDYEKLDHDSVASSRRRSRRSNKRR